ncbi:uncharacterized protein LOC131596872 [Vicia villosa]|uniref:uncharacterized protein LOC131596872 n=1 Tax=Vicia villosa TaxID=3911 RepID=UPI00273A82E8|nr:uncharacterized protein LOC131596872 [Vicia villosa]
MYDRDREQALLKEMVNFQGDGLLCNAEERFISDKYAARFSELAKFYPHYSEATAEFFKCIKFENRLCPEIKGIIGYQKIHKFPDLVDRCRTYEEDSKAHYKAMSVRVESNNIIVGNLTMLQIIKHEIAECRHKQVICLNYGEEGHIGAQCQKPKRAQTGGKIFALVGTQISSEDRLIRGICFINSTPLILINISATHYFIAADCVERLSLVLSSIKGEMVVNTPSKGLVTTSPICSKCPLSIFDRLLCGLSLFTVERSRYGETGFLSSSQLNELMKDEAQVFALMASLSVENRATIDELTVVREFAKVFPNKIPDVPPEREVEFTVDLVTSTKLVSKAPYRISVYELVELKKQLEELLEKKFVKPSVSHWGAPVLLIKKKDDSMRLCVDY